MTSEIQEDLNFNQNSKLSWSSATAQKLRKIFTTTTSTKWNSTKRNEEFSLGTVNYLAKEQFFGKGFFKSSSNFSLKETLLMNYNFLSNQEFGSFRKNSFENTKFLKNQPNDDDNHIISKLATRVGCRLTEENIQENIESVLPGDKPLQTKTGDETVAVGSKEIFVGCQDKKKDQDHTDLIKVTTFHWATPKVTKRKSATPKRLITSENSDTDHTIARDADWDFLNEEQQNSLIPNEKPQRWSGVGNNSTLILLDEEEEKWVLANYDESEADIVSINRKSRNVLVEEEEEEEEEESLIVVSNQNRGNFSPVTVGNNSTLILLDEEEESWVLAYYDGTETMDDFYRKSTGAILDEEASLVALNPETDLSVNTVDNSSNTILFEPKREESVTTDLITFSSSTLDDNPTIATESVDTTWQSTRNLSEEENEELKSLSSDTAYNNSTKLFEDEETWMSVNEDESVEKKSVLFGPEDAFVIRNEETKKSVMGKNSTMIEEDSFMSTNDVESEIEENSLELKKNYSIGLSTISDHNALINSDLNIGYLQIPEPVCLKTETLDKITVNTTDYPNLMEQKIVLKSYNRKRNFDSKNIPKSLPNRKIPKFSNILSPVSMYIKNSPRVPQIKRIYKKETTNGPLFAKTLSKVINGNKENQEGTLPLRLYKPSKQTIVAKNSEEKFYKNIKKYIRVTPEITKHKGRVNKKRFDLKDVEEELLKEDLSVGDENILSLSSVSLEDISLVSIRNAYIK